MITLYLLFCLIYGIKLFLEKQENRIVKIIIIIFFPVFGFLVTYVLFKSTNSKSNENKSDTSEELLLHPSKGRINVEREINIIPFQDALLLNEHNIKRSMLIDILKDGIRSFGLLNKAIKSSDSEISHYAAATVMEIQKKFVTTLQDLMKRLKESPLDYEAMDCYTKTLKKYISSGLMDQETKAQYQGQLSNFLEKLLESPLRCKDYFIDKIDCDLEIGNYEKAQYFSQQFIEEYPLDEASYLTSMKVFYTMQNPKKITEIMNKLKKMPIQLSPKGLNALHFWL